MTPEQQAAYVTAQAACALIEAQAMLAQNNADALAGQMPRHGAKDFVDLIEKYRIHHNAVMEDFRP